MSARSTARKRKAGAKRLADKSRRQRASAKPRFTLHGFWLSGPTYKVGLMLSLSGAPFSYAHVNLREGEHKRPDYLAKNRYGQVPCLSTGKMHLCQSASILEYLADALGKFKGRGAEETARIREWMFWDFDRLAPGIYRARAVKRGFRQAGADTLAMYETEGKAGLAVLEEALAESPLLVGKRPTIADIDAYGVVHFAADGGFDLSAFPHVSAWKQRMEKLRGFGTPEQVLPKQSRP